MRLLSAFPVIFLIWKSVSAADAGTLHHDLDVTIDPYTSMLEVVDRLTIPQSLAEGELRLGLYDKLKVRSLTDGIDLELSAESIEAGDVGMDRESEIFDAPIRINEYRVVGGNRSRDLELTIMISGKINVPIEPVGGEYARGFSTSPGLIEKRGVYLAGSTYWLPQIGKNLMTYDMEVALPEGWRSVAQGKRLDMTDGPDGHVDTWSVTTPTEEVHLIAAQFTEYSFDVDTVKAMAFLRKTDDNLAERYLEATAQYLQMYRSLLGPYPYSKFALVENFWDTGYGMPSFTLLGEQVIRFPFILHSSYPHELLHNWWGNGVFVDFPSGNWSEGLTTYMADHLVAEQRGQGADYRRSLLQRYTDYVKANNDFPLSEFRSRHDAVTEAVGYGKTAMVFDMLREKVGDSSFVNGLKSFYNRNKFTRASFDDLRDAFEDETGNELNAFFDQWVRGAGAPSLVLDDVSVEESKRGYTLSFALEQRQSSPAFDMDIPVAVYSRDGVIVERVNMTDKFQAFEFELEARPLRVEVDPAFNLFRRLDAKETPPSLSQAFGSDRVLIVLPSNADSVLRSRYRKLSGLWKKLGAETSEVVLDSEIEALPTERSIWLFGDDNSFQPLVAKALSRYDAGVDAQSARFGGTELDKSDHSIVVVVRHPSNNEQVIVWLTAAHDEVIPRLANVLPHYGKYSYLGFVGKEAKNVASGEWPVIESPLMAQLSDEPVDFVLEARPALASLDPVFTSERMQAHVDYLASDELEGRGVGTAGLDKAADYIAEKYEEFGLQPGSDGTYFQTFTVRGENDADVEVKNVIGVLSGVNPESSMQSVVVSAHYDHLGYGWPDVRQDFKGQIHNGADDNASGTAILLELARVIGKGEAHQRSVVFVAFTAEEAGLLGARHYVRNTDAYPVDRVIANLNMDTVGRLGDNAVMIFGGLSSDDWPVFFADVSAATGIDVKLAKSNLSASDNAAFVEVGVPAIQIFSGAGRDYHRPSDTPDKIDADGMVKVATLVREAVEKLAARKEPMKFRLVETTERPQGSRQRRVGTGTMPDFAFAGPGVRVQSIAVNSPAEKAGLRQGDIIVGLGNSGVADLVDFTRVLGEFEPGDVVEFRYMRDGDERTGSMTLTVR